MTYEELLIDMVKKDDRIMILTSENRAAIRNLPSKIPGNFIDTGIAEQTMTGMSAGLALRGRIPIVHALAAFLTMRAFEFIRTDIGIANLPVKLVGAFAGFLSEANGPTHQAIEDISLMRAIPNMHIFCPADEHELLLGLPKIIKDPFPYYIRYTNLKTGYTHDKDFIPGKAEIIFEGNDVTIITYGLLFYQALKAVDILKEKGYSAGLINLRMLKPVDSNAILEVCRNSGLIVTLEDHFLTGGLYSITAEILADKNIKSKILPFALNDRWFKPSLLNSVLEYEGFTAEKIAGKIISELNNSASKQLKDFITYYG